MCGLKPKKYHRPYLIIEPFHPNEYVAACVKNTTSWIFGEFCVDLNSNGHFDAYEDRKTGNYLGDYQKNLIKNGDFVINSHGRYSEGGGLAYLFIGEGNFDSNVQSDENLEVPYYTYSNNSYYKPLYYASVSLIEGGSQGEPFNIYFTDEEYSLGVTNVS